MLIYRFLNPNPDYNQMSTIFTISEAISFNYYFLITQNFKVSCYEKFNFKIDVKML